MHKETVYNTKPFKIELTDEVIASNSGIAMAGFMLGSPEFTEILKPISKTDTDKDYKNIDILKSYLGLLSLGKVNYEDIDQFRNDPFFKSAIGLAQLPSKETLRQRINDLSYAETEQCVKEYNIQLINKHGNLLRCCDSEFIPVDFDVSPFDNSGSKKEGVSYTYKKVEGYAPMFTYIGGTGYMLNNQLREGKAHSNCEGTADYIRQTLTYARAITTEKLLCRFDSGNDSVENIDVLNSYKGIYYLIKKNFRRESQEKYIAFAKSKACVEERSREGKVIYYHSKYVKLSMKDTCGKIIKYVRSRLVVRLIERTIDAKGQQFLIPEQDLEAWYTDLGKKYTEKQVIRFYEDHGTSEQFHSEFKTDMDVERLPSGKFATNSLVITLGMLAYNILRTIGTYTLSSGMLNRKRPVKRIRIRKVLQDIMYMACHFIVKCRRKTLKLATGNVFAKSFMFAYNQLLYSG